MATRAGGPDPERSVPRRRHAADEEPTAATGLPVVGGGPTDRRPPAGQRPLPGAPDVRAERIGPDAGVEINPAEPPGRHRRRAAGSTEAGSGKPDRSPAQPASRARPGRRRRSSFWKELPLLIVVALVLTFLIQTFLAKVYVIPSGSMETTLHGCVGCNNDRVLVDKLSYRFGEPAPGDVVVFRGPDSWSSEVIVQQPTNALVRGMQLLGSLVGLAPPDEKDFVKRVIAVGGQTVQCCDSRNRVLVDGQPLDEPYIYYLPEAGPARQNAFGPVKVPDGQLWMMGDSRNNSADSRVADHGPVPVANVIGKARWIVLPFNRFGPIHSVDPQTTAVGLPAPGTTGFGSDLDAPLALGLIGVLPWAVGRRRALWRAADPDAFLPDDPRPITACDPSQQQRR